MWRTFSTAPHRPHQDAVGGTVPGYAGHRPASAFTHGESAWGGVPGRMDDHIFPGQGTALPRTTQFEEVGVEFKPHEQSRSERFRGQVSGIKVGYGGHVPGAQNHFGSNHQGQVPLRDAASIVPHAAPPRELSPAEQRRHTFVEARELAQASGTTRQFHEVSGVNNTAPFGVDQHVRYTTEAQRTGGQRGQAAARGKAPSSHSPHRVSAPPSPESVMADPYQHHRRHDHHRPGPAATAVASSPPGAVASALYDRDVRGRRSPAVPGASGGDLSAGARVAPSVDLHGSAAIGLEHTPPPDARAASRLTQFVVGAGQLDDHLDAKTGGYPAPPSHVARTAQGARAHPHSLDNDAPRPIAARPSTPPRQPSTPPPAPPLNKEERIVEWIRGGNPWAAQGWEQDKHGKYTRAASPPPPAARPPLRISATPGLAPAGHFAEYSGSQYVSPAPPPPPARGRPASAPPLQRAQPTGAAPPLTAEQGSDGNPFSSRLFGGGGAASTRRSCSPPPSAQRPSHRARTPPGGAGGAAGKATVYVHDRPPPSTPPRPAAAHDAGAPSSYSHGRRADAPQAWGANSRRPASPRAWRGQPVDPPDWMLSA